MKTPKEEKRPVIKVILVIAYPVYPIEKRTRISTQENISDIAKASSTSFILSPWNAL